MSATHIFLLSLALILAEAQDSSVIIVGSGIAGIACARGLIDAGVRNVTILEARARKGGRLFTANIGGYPIDQGGAWIHGQTGNPLTALAQTYRLATAASGDDNTLFSDTGALLPTSTITRQETLTTQYTQYVQSQRGSSSVSVSLEDLWQVWPGRANLNAADVTLTRQGIHSRIEQEYAASLRNLSALYYDNEEAFGGSDLLWTNGYGSLLEAMSQGMNILYNKTVTSIDYSSTPVVVTTSDGQVYRATYVVSTLPLGVLQSSLGPTFTPPLSGAKADAISKLGMGLLNKVILVYRTAFWTQDANTFWINRVPSVTGDYSEFFSLSKPLGIPVLIAFTAGDFAWSQEPLNDTAILASIRSKLSAMFPRTYQDPVSYNITRWGRDPYSYGSYSFMKAGSTPDAYTSLAQPLNNRLFFAGEATHQTYPATAHGALLSGQREAQRIVKLIQGNSAGYIQPMTALLPAACVLAVLAVSRFI